MVVLGAGVADDECTFLHNGSLLVMSPPCSGHPEKKGPNLHLGSVKGNKLPL